MDNQKIIRPQGFESERRDCTIRALSLVTNIPYEKVYFVVNNYGRRKNSGFAIQKVLHKIAFDLGIKFKQVKRSGSLAKLIQEYPKGKLYCIRYGHAFAVIDGVSHDENNLKRHIKQAWLLIPKELI